jgi:hypothetical protein
MLIHWLKPIVIKRTFLSVGPLWIVAGIVIVIGAGITEVGFTLSAIKRNSWVPVRF